MASDPTPKDPSRRDLLQGTFCTAATTIAATTIAATTVATGTLAAQEHEPAQGSGKARAPVRPEALLHSARRDRNKEPRRHLPRAPTR